jgi:hypothetical protein
MDESKGIVYIPNEEAMQIGLKHVYIGMIHTVVLLQCLGGVQPFNTTCQYININTLKRRHVSAIP